MNGNTEIKRHRWKKPLFITLVSLISVLILISVAFFIYVGNFYEADEASVSAFLGVWESECYNDEDGNTVFKPDGAEAGFIFYPGGKVEADAYKPLMSALADRGILCVLVDMPFNLAVFDINAADGIREQHPEITEWYIGGHSLGGSMAASYLLKHPNDFHGLVLLGSYSTEDLSELSIDVLSVYGSEDGVMNREKYEECKKNLPSNAQETVINGGCHAYFGMYGEQKGDGIPTVTNAEQINKTADIIAELRSDVYFVATVLQNDKVIATPYSGDKEVPSGLDGVFYSTDEPGGKPKNGEDVSIWLKLTPTEAYKVNKVNVSGEYSSVESVGGDVYRISGVKSNLTVSVKTLYLTSTSREFFEELGYGISDDGYLTLKWKETKERSIRYIEITSYDQTSYKTEYVDASGGEATSFKMTENVNYLFTVKAVGYDNIGSDRTFELCYMTEPRSISFPRVEITTEGFVWPDFDVVNSPNKYWGQGITNAEYEQCLMTIYNESNEVVFTSAGVDGGVEYGGAKMKVRGNTSASKNKGGKLPYKIKLNEKADLLEPLIGREDGKSGYADKNWLLLSYGEDGYRIGGEAVADAVGTQWSPDYCYVSLYVNGDYRGLYVLSESVKEGNGAGEDQWRVPVADDGFLFECDAYWWNEDLYFNTPLTEKTPMFFTFKYPDAENISAASPAYQYIKDYMIRFEEALLKDDDSYLDYIDLESFVKWLLVSDYICISDGGGANIFLYKYDSTDASRVHLGPNWDFDSWMGGVENLSTIRMKWSTSPFYIPYLLEKDSFNEMYNQLFEETKDEIVAAVNEAFSEIDMEAHDELLQYEFARYGKQYKSLSQIQEEFTAWLTEHIAWMDTQLN